MPCRSPSIAWSCRAALALAAVAAALLWSSSVGAQTTGTTTDTTAITTIATRAVGGVSIDAGGMLANATRDEVGKLRGVLKDALSPVPDGMNQTAGLRKISLAALDAEIQKCLDAKKPLSDAAQCLAGLQRIQYVLVYPEKNDVVLAGPAQGWKLDAKGNLVGAENGLPVMLLDDFVVAFRAALHKPSALSCSIDPTPEGRQNFQKLIGQMGTMPSNKGAFAAAIQQQVGPQSVTVEGVPPTSHFARVMIAADYRMKRISMAFEPSPVRGLPSFMEMVSSGSRNAMPRFWLEPQYSSILRDGDGLAWEIRGGSVRAMAETDFVDAQNNKTPTGKADPISARWAKLMTERYDELSVADPTFGQLRNCMDAAVVATLIARERLPEKVKNSFPALSGPKGLPTVSVDAPKQVATQANFNKKGRNWVIAAGGVQINPWAIVEKTETSQELTAVHSKAAKARSAWWWD